MQKVIEKVIKDFNFEKVHKAMAATNWTWLNEEESPSVCELILCAIRLLEEAYTMEPGHSVSTGGFRATNLYNNVDGVGLSLEFIVTESEFYEREQK